MTILRAARLAGIAALAALVAFAPTLRRVVVDGRSMEPTLLPGDRLLLLGPSLLQRVRPRSPVLTELVAVRDPREPGRVLVKRVASVDHDARTVLVLGDNRTHSTDSRTFGPIPWASVLGRPIYRYGPANRTGSAPWAEEYDRR